MEGIPQQKGEQVTVMEAWKIIKILRSETTVMAGFSIDSIDALCKSFFYQYLYLSS